MKQEKRKLPICVLILFCTVALMISCGNQSNVGGSITEKSKMIEAIAPVNDAITRFGDLKSGTITTEYTDYAMPANIATKDEIVFERTEQGEIKYTITETYIDGRKPFIEERVAENGILPEQDYIFYPSRKLDTTTFDNVQDVVVTKGDNSTTYRINWTNGIPTQNEGILTGVTYDEYTIDNKGVLTEVTHYFSFNKENDKSKEGQAQGRTVIKLTNYTM